MSLASRITLLSQRIGAEFKTIRAEMASISGGAHVGDSPPESPTIGQIWHDTDDPAGDILPVPPGVILPYGGTAAPTGYLLCQGQTVSKTTYPDLYAVFLTTYGPETSTTFTLPDLQQYVPVGRKAGDADFGTLGQKGGAKTHQLTEAEMPSHNHTFTTWGHPQPISATGGAFVRHTATDAIITYNINTNTKGGDAAHNNLQPYIALNYIVKT